MDESSKPLTEFTIRNALLELCFPERVEDVRFCEQYFTSQQLAGFGYPNLGGTSNRGEPMPAPPQYLGRLRNELTEAWKELLLDFIKRLERREFRLTGVQTTPTLEEQRKEIPGQWAVEFKIDAQRDVIQHRKARYVMVRVETAEAQPVVVAPAEPTKGRRPTITAENIRDLTDDEVLFLLEDHARRVTEGPDAKLIASSKISFMPIIHRRMRFRAASGELAISLAAEAKVLADWIASKVPSHQVPTEGTIKNSVRSEYARLKARSNSIMP